MSVPESSFLKRVFGEKEQETEVLDRALDRAEEAVAKEIPDRSILLDAIEVVENRQQKYGPPQENLANIAQMWSAYFGIPVDARDVCNAMILLKVARDSSVPDSENHLDIAGYIECADLIGVTETEDVPV